VELGAPAVGDGGGGRGGAGEDGGAGAGRESLIVGRDGSATRQAVSAGPRGESRSELEFVRSAGLVCETRDLETGTLSD